MPELEFEPTVSEGKQPQTYGLDSVATEIGQEEHNSAIIQIYHVATYYVLTVRTI
jgi:hypothetical protein